MAIDEAPRRGRRGMVGGMVGGLIGLGVLGLPAHATGTRGPATVPRLPGPATTGATAFETALLRRRSARSFARSTLALADAAQLLWAAQGITDARGHRTAPSAGALYPLELVLVAGQIDGLRPGCYRHLVSEHALLALAEGDRRAALAAATRGQPWVAEAPLLLAVAADPTRTAARYGERAGRYVAMEAGAAVQNVYLQCSARGWATTLVGAFDDASVRAALGLVADEVVLALMPVGVPARG